MPRTVDTSSTLENFRVEHNNLATDIGAIGNLTTGDTSSVVNAINYIMDQYFFFQDFDFDGSDGATSNTVFSGLDNVGNTLQYSAGKVLVYKNGLLLRNGTDYTASNGTSITLASSAGNSDVVRVSSYTGSYQNVNSESSSAFDAWQSAGGVIYNKNTGGIAFNADASITTTPTVGNSFQFDGPSYYNDHVHVNAVSSAPKEIRFRDADNSNYAGIKAPATISANYTLTLPTDDGTSGQSLTTNGSGVLSWAAAGTPSDITITANNSTNETVYPVFVDGATGSQGLESDTGLTYNPSTNSLACSTFTGSFTGDVAGNIAGTVTQASQGSITAMANLVTVGTITTGAWQGTAIASNYIGADAITGAKIADDAINSEHYTNASIDTAHIDNDQITNALMANNAVDAAVIVDNSVGAAELNVSGNGSSSQALLSDGDGTFSWGSSGHSTEELQDIIGAMFSSNTETRISATYQDGDGTIDLVVDDMTANTTYSVGDGGLTTNNFTNADHSKLDGLVSNATHTGDVTGSGALTIAAGAVDLAMLSAGGTRNTGTFYRGDGTFAAYSSITGAGSAATVTSGTQSSITSAANLTTVGTIGTGTWQGTAINQTYLTGQSGTNTGDQSSVSGSSGSCSGLAASATVLATARTIGGVSFNGSANINLPGVNAAGNQSTSGNAGSATVLATARTIGGVSFNGSANINLPGVNAAGNQDTTGTASKVDVATNNTNTTFDVVYQNDDVIMKDGNSDLTFNPSTNLLHTAGAITAGGDITAYYSSDVAFKENISPISQALEKVGLISGYEFDWKDHKDPQVLGKGHDVGIIAQEVEKVLPEVVITRENGKKAVNYSKIIPLLIESIKELKSELDDLKSSNS